MKIGVFDSGIGGQAVAQRLAELLSATDILYVNDHAHVPYGSRKSADIIRLTEAAIQPLLVAQCDAIVIACNTATTVAIDYLRNTHPTINFVGIEPMVKSAAAMTRSKVIAVLATPATLASTQYAHLKETWAKGSTVIEPRCDNWATLIETGRSEEVPIEAVIHQVIEQGADVVVLACTHYHWLNDRAETASGTQATILEPSDAIGSRILSLLGESL